ncbi:MAG: 50S ribosomal protein L11 methyltransferase [Leptolinea sp.]|nr:50S ribosomal protein L11 methyltransferase [Leptolinea sp.]
MADPRWLEVSLTGDGEIVEAVSEVMGRFVTGGVVTESGVEYRGDEDEGTAVGPVRIFGFIVVDENLETTRHNLEEALWHLGQIHPLPPLEFRYIKDENWMTAWKEHYQPIPIGKKLLVLPAWLPNTYPERIAVKIDPSMAFGTGTHPTTRLCMQALEIYQEPDKPVIDVGCGSGILSITAALLGAPHVLAVDIDNAAVVSTKENAQANGVLDKIETGIGSVKEIKNGLFSRKRAPVVVANILAPVIIRLFDAGLAYLVASDGTIILSGILAEQADSVEAAAATKGLSPVERLQIDDWVAQVFKK